MFSPICLCTTINRSLFLGYSLLVHVFTRNKAAHGSAVSRYYTTFNLLQLCALVFMGVFSNR